VTIYLEIVDIGVSLGGTAMLALTHFLEQYKFQNPIAHCLVCTDRDTAGHLAYSNISEKLTVMVSRTIPVGKDWNETLQQIRNEVTNNSA
jgi:DNA primase